MNSVFERWQFASLAEAPAAAAAVTARNIKAGQAAAAEQARAAAHAVAHSAGFAAGLEQGRAAVEAEAARLRAIISSMSYAMHTLQDEVGLAVAGLALDVARQVLRSELAANRESMLPAIQEALDLAGSGPNPQLLLNPADVEFVTLHLGEELAANKWRVNGDTRVDPCGCRVTTANGSIDATLAMRWRRVAAAMGSDDAWEK